MKTGNAPRFPRLLVPRPLFLLLICAFWLADVARAAPFPQAYLKASNTDPSDYFGLKVAISGDTMVVGAYGEDSSATGVNGPGGDNNANAAGAAYVFVRTGTNWTQQAYLKASNTGEYDYFGLAVAISGDTIVIGAPYEDSDARGVNGSGGNDNANEAGAAYVFVRTGTNWTQQAYLKASNGEAGDEFGTAVAISGNSIVVGAWREDSDAFDSGAVYIFVRNGNSWSQQTYLKASNCGAGDEFGEAVAISGDTIMVGASSEDSSARGLNGNQNNEGAYNSGAAYVFVRNGTSWSQQAYLKASNAEADDRFGQGVAVDGDTAVAGALSESSRARQVNGDQADNSAHHAGAAYVFARNGTNWSQQAYLKAFNAEAWDAFGFPVSISGDTVVVGAQSESSDGANAWNNNAFWAGAAYVFARGGTNWIQHAYLKASNPGGGVSGLIAGDMFGGGLAISGDTVVVGAYLEDSDATGVNGDQSNNNAADSGTAYVFAGLGLGIFPDGLGGYAVRFKQTPGLSYRLLRAPEVTGVWNAIATNLANGLGIVSFHDTNAPPDRAFYHTAQP
ncbi:MAG: FG-GAP repeat protein [Verrucomicrobiota bacterium]